MRIRNKLMIIIAVSILIISCEQTNEPTGGDPQFIPSFQNTWQVQNSSNHTIFLDSDDIGLNSGIFYGEEDDPDNNINGAHLCGRFDNRRVEFNIRRPGGTVKFKGSFVAEDKIEASSPTDSIVLIRPN
ncbi:MAG: hypothetical protein HND52_20165 [Ignavibacteriae bacterium]|nr:hypothetical protein [Ignavibacteriota bacterium]NOH00286.1 hypothetical protein [Ignavibacteriota bacterium]